MLQLCPKCNGQGVVSKPPYVAGDVQEWTGSAISFVCDICNGAKVIVDNKDSITEPEHDADERYSYSKDFFLNGDGKVVNSAGDIVKDVVLITDELLMPEKDDMLNTKSDPKHTGDSLGTLAKKAYKNSNEKGVVTWTV